MSTLRSLSRCSRVIGLRRMLQTRHSSSSKLADGDLKSVKPMFDLTGKNFVITGGSRGIGYGAARAIAEMGGNVSVLDILPKPVGDFEQLFSQLGVKSLYINTDVTKQESLQSAFEQTAIELGGIDGCITAAGVALNKPFLEQTPTEVERLNKINVEGTFLAAQCATQHMIQQGKGGSIIMIASVCASMAIPGHKLSSYNVTKGAVKMLSKALSVELAPHAIRCNTVSPGYIETDMTRLLREEQPHLVDIMNKAPPLKRIGNRNDLTGAFVYLLSDASSYVTGVDILVDGGLHAGRIEWPS